MFKYFNKGISTPIAIGIILVLAVLVGGFTLWQYSEIEKQDLRGGEVSIPEKKEGENISDRKTYRNEEIGIEFKYPEIIFGSPKIRHYSEQDKSSITGKKISITFEKKPNIRFYARTSNFSAVPPESDIFTKTKEISSYCQEPLSLILYGNPYCKYTMCKITELSGETAVFEVCASSYECSCDSFLSVYFINPTGSEYESLEFYIRLEDAHKKICEGVPTCTRGGDETIVKPWLENILTEKNLSIKDKEDLEIFNQILSTFRFLD